MPTFIVRVELHGADGEDYELLHEKMQGAGFRRTITGDNGTTYHLPTAEYEMESDATRSEVIGEAMRAAASTKKKFGTIVTESKGQIWWGLEEVMARVASR